MTFIFPSVSLIILPWATQNNLLRNMFLSNALNDLQINDNEYINLVIMC